MAPSKSKFRGPEAKTYQLLHRSLRDPLINDPEASDRILSEVVKGKGKARATDTDLASTFGELDIRPNEGEAAEYGILYDDTEYDYMQHLRTTGSSREAIFVEAAPRQQSKASKRGGEIVIPDEALPAHPDDERDYNELVGIPDKAYGLQPDMDPRLREALEALEDEAFVDGAWQEHGEEGDDFFDELVQGAAPEQEDDEWEDEPETGYEADMARFKKARPVTSDGSDLDSEGGDTVGELRASSARRPPRGPQSRVSEFSMSSSSMFRSEGLQTLDDQFDAIEREYADSNSEEDDDDDDAPDLLDFTQFDPTETRGDLEEMMDDFLSRYEVLGGKLKPALEGLTPSAKLDTLRRELLGERDGTISDGLQAEEKARIAAMADAILRREARKKEKPDLVPIERYEDKYDRWDCETILSTYSNLENHPRLLSARGFVSKPEPRIRLDPKTGMPTPAESARTSVKKPLSTAEPVPSPVRPAKQTVARTRDETPEERKKRKHLVKAERQERRQEKKTTKMTFVDERRRQQKQQNVLQANAADVSGQQLGATTIKLS